MANVPHQAKSTSQTTSGAYGLQVVRIMSSNQCTCSKCACMLTMTSMTPGCDVSPVASISGIDFSYLVASVLSINIRMPKDMAMEESIFAYISAGQSIIARSGSIALVKQMLCVLFGRTKREEKKRTGQRIQQRRLLTRTGQRLQQRRLLLREDKDAGMGVVHFFAGIRLTWC
eukprot:1160177-Pelagomonas_calceolata.AAC.5